MRARPNQLAPRAFTMIEVMIVLIIMAICATLAMGAISNYEASQRPERAARECQALLRYARNLALTTGKTACLRINTTNNTMAVYWQSNGTSYDANPVSSSAGVGGQLLIDLDTQREIAGVRMTLSGGGTSQDFAYNALGSGATSGTITFSYGTRARSIVIPRIGEATVN